MAGAGVVRILYLAPDPVPAPKGASVRIARTVQTLRELGHDVEVLTPAVEAAPAGNFLERMLAFRAEAAGWLAARRAEAVQFRSIWEGVPAVAWARRTGARAIFEAHGFPSVELGYHFPALAGHGRVLDKIIAEERGVLEASDAVHVPSLTTARFVRRLGVPAERIHVIPNAVDVDLFSPPAAPPPDEPPFRAVYLGTLSPWQGLATLLEALALRRSTAGVELHVVGPLKGAWARALRAHARGLRVHHALHLSGAVAQADVPPILRTAHVCVAPLADDARNSLQGCCPIKLLEYMAVGRPILTTRLPVVEEILEHGVTGYLAQPGSAAALADGLRWMRAHPVEREAMGARAREAVRLRWTPAEFRRRLAQAIAPVRAGAAGVA
jgi:glycosyltransferase involved in cell wall biosynthesis